MKPQYYIVLSLLLLYSVLATSGANATSGGCNLVIPKAVKGHMEAEGYPLQISIIMSIQQVRDVPDSGGSFGVDLE